ncbi:MAG: T9SS type A sorting domain-containing protein [Bacteroidales bacterium]|nr:T9SS type A sorting domain-containing protein [Bacteroidales bacterium]
MKIFITAIILFFVSGLFAQYTITGNNGETIVSESGSLYLGTYYYGQEYKVTLCSENPLCSHIQLEFTDFENVCATYCVFDGPNDTYPLLGCNIWSENEIVAASQSNLSGCLTFVFSSTANGSNIGGNFNCNFSCQSIQANVYNSFPAVNSSGSINYLNMCSGDSIRLFGNGIYQNSTYPQHDGTSLFVWDFGNGHLDTGFMVSYVYPQAGIYNINLEITDYYGCKSKNSIHYVAQVSSLPNFISNIQSDTFCMAELIPLNIISNFQSFVPEFCNFDYESSGQLIDTGSVLQLPININCLPSGTIVDSVAQILSICTNIEHSFLGDLIIKLTCPYNIFTGASTEVILHNQTGFDTFLGEALDDGSTNPGTGWDYCWAVPGNTDYAQTMGSYAYSTDTLPSGSYLSVQPLSNFVGCEINGNWILTIADNWVSDNGTVFSWGIQFDETITSNILEQQNYPSNETWFHNYGENGMILEIGENFYASAFGEPMEVTSEFFTYLVTDNFGCEYDTTIILFFKPITDTNCCNLPSSNITSLNHIIPGNYTILDAENLDYPTNHGYWIYSGPGIVDFLPDSNSNSVQVYVSEFGTYCFYYIERNFGTLNCFSSDSITIEFVDTEINNSEIINTQTAVYPNPFTNKLFVRTKNINIESIIITDIAGKEKSCKILQKSKNNYEIETNNINSGIYLLNIYTKDGYFKEKIIKVRVP